MIRLKRLKSIFTGASSTGTNCHYSLKYNPSDHSLKLALQSLLLKAEPAEGEHKKYLDPTLTSKQLFYLVTTPVDLNPVS